MGQEHQRRWLSNSHVTTTTTCTVHLLLVYFQYNLSYLNSTPLPSSSLSSLPLPHHTDHLLYLGHPAPSTKSTTTVAVVTRYRGASCHGVSPGPSHPSRTTGCAHCCVTELLRLKWGGEEIDTEQQRGTVSTDCTCTHTQVDT